MYASINERADGERETEREIILRLQLIIESNKCNGTNIYIVHVYIQIYIIM